MASVRGASTAWLRPTPWAVPVSHLSSPFNVPDVQHQCFVLCLSGKQIGANGGSREGGRHVKKRGDSVSPQGASATTTR